MAEGDISAPQDTLVWNALAIERPRAIHITGGIYAFAYEEHDDKGKVSTVNIDSAGNIGAALVDSLEFESSQMATPDIIHISGNVFAIVHNGMSDDGFVRTVTINDDGSIDDSVIDTFEFETTNCRFPKIFHIAGTTYGICYSKDYTGKVATVTIAANGQISEPIIDSLVYDATSGAWSTPIKIADNIFAIFYNRNNLPGRVVTLTISDGGAITNTPIDSVEIDNGVLTQCDAAHVSGAIYAYTYTKEDYKGYIKTIDIASDGNIGAVIDTLLFDGAIYLWGEQHVLRVSATIICITYQGAGDDGYMKTIEIDSAGNITDPVMDTLEFDNAGCNDPMLIPLSGGVYAVFYRNVNGYGTIKTPAIEALVAGRIKYLPLMGIG